MQKSLTLGSHCLHLCNNVGGDELAKVDTANVAEETELELLELELGEIKPIEETELLELEESLELLELEDSVKVKLLGLEEVLEAEDVKVVDLPETTEELEIDGVDLEQVVQIDLIEVVQVVEEAQVEGGALLSRGSGSQGGEKGDEDGSGLHFDCAWRMNGVDSKQRSDDY